MDARLTWLAVLLVPLIASCATTSGIATKAPVSSVCEAPQSTPVVRSCARVVEEPDPSPLASFCSLGCSGRATDQCASHGDKVPGNASGLVKGRKHPLVPELHFPVPTGTLSSRFGFRRGVFHGGLDIKADKGDPVHACDGGTVVFIGSRKGYRSYGNAVLVDHGRDVFTHYAHLSRILVCPGQKVKRGETIALVGSTGRSTSPHLHLEVKVGKELFNPVVYFSPHELRTIQVAKSYSGAPMGPVRARLGKAKR